MEVRDRCPLSSFSCPAPPTFPIDGPSHAGSPWTPQGRAGYLRVLPRAGAALSARLHAVSFLFCASAGPPQGLISMVVLWKVSAPRSTLWPNVVIRNSDKKRQNTRQEGGARGPGAAAENV